MQKYFKQKITLWHCLHTPKVNRQSSIANTPTRRHPLCRNLLFNMFARWQQQPTHLLPINVVVAAKHQQQQHQYKSEALNDIANNKQNAHTTAFSAFPLLPHQHELAMFKCLTLLCSKVTLGYVRIEMLHWPTQVSWQFFETGGEWVQQRGTGAWGVPAQACKCLRVTSQTPNKFYLVFSNFAPPSPNFSHRLPKGNVRRYFYLYVLPSIL